MIIKSYEIEKKTSNFIKYNFFLLYGENDGLKKHIKESLRVALHQKDSNIEILTLFENDIINNEEDFYNSIFSGSLFSNKKIITIHNVTDKITKQINDILGKYPKNIFIIIFSNILEKKSKLRKSGTKINEKLNTGTTALSHFFLKGLCGKIRPKKWKFEKVN